MNLDPVTSAAISWAIGQLGAAGVRAGHRLLLPSPARRALRDIAHDAIRCAVDAVVSQDGDEVRLELMTESADVAQLDAASVLDLRQTLVDKLRFQLAALADRGCAVDADRLVGEIADRIESGIKANAATDGPLAPLAEALRSERLVKASESTAHSAGRIAAEIRTLSQSRPGQPPASRDPARTRRLSNLPARNPHFTGRAEAMALLSDLLKQQPGTVVAVHGLGGVGKTELVLEYAWTHRDDYAIIWWVHAADTVELTADLRRLWYALTLDREASLEQAVNALRAELTARSDWLLICDNVSEAASIRGFLPGGDGHVLLTSRERNWTGVARVSQLGELSATEATDYLRSSTGQDAPEAGELAEALGYLPLALAQAAGYITVKNCSMARYLELYRFAAERLLAEGPRPHGYPDTVATTWRLHFESLSGSALAVLKLLAFLAPDAIPLGQLLDTTPAGNMPEALRELVSDQLVRETVFGELVSTSLLTRLDDHTFRLHRLVQEVTRADLSKQDHAVWLERAAQLVQAAMPVQPQLYENWDRVNALTPHVQQIAMRTKPYQQAAVPVVGLLHAVGLYLTEQERWDPAQKVLDQALALALFTDRTRVAEASIKLSMVTVRLGRHQFNEALELAKGALDIMEKVYGRDHPELVGPLLVTASIFAPGLIPDAEQAHYYLSRVQKLLSRAGLVPPRIALSARMQLGTYLIEIQEFDQAQIDLEEALKLATGLYGARSDQAAMAYGALAWVDRGHGEHGAADAKMSLSIEIIGERFGADHPYTQRLVSRRALWRAERS